MLVDLWALSDGIGVFVLVDFWDFSDEIDVFLPVILIRWFCIPNLKLALKPHLENGVFQVDAVFFYLNEFAVAQGCLDA